MINVREKRQILKTALNFTVTLKTITKKVDFKCSPLTVRRVIYDSGIIVFKDDLSVHTSKQDLHLRNKD